MDNLGPHNLSFRAQLLGGAVKIQYSNKVSKTDQLIQGLQECILGVCDAVKGVVKKSGQ